MPAITSESSMLVALFLYSFQIYLDFSGYSDIAIGSARIFGLEIAENFNQPYFARDFSQFWKRWHMTLSSWIQDYVFFPLMRFSSNRTWQVLLVPVIAMSLCGAWHDARINFIYWGAYHGLLISISQLWNVRKRRSRKLAGRCNRKWFVALEASATFMLVTLGWMFFNNTYTIYLKIVLRNMPLLLFIMAIVFVVQLMIAHVLAGNLKDFIIKKYQGKWLRYSFYVLLFLIYNYFGLSLNTFIYMGF